MTLIKYSGKSGPNLVNARPGCVSGEPKNFPYHFVNSLNLSSIGPNPASVIEDTVLNYLYITLETSPGIIVRVNKSNFTIKDYLTLNIGENIPFEMALDTQHGFLYVGLFGSGGIAKINTATFTEVGTALQLIGTIGVPAGIIIDSNNKYLYCGTHGDDPDWVFKIDLSIWSIVNSFQGQFGNGLNPRLDEISFYCLALDEINGFLYVGEDTGQIMKVQLSNFTKIATLSFPFADSSDGVGGIGLDINNHIMYIATAANPDTHGQAVCIYIISLNTFKITTTKKISLFPNINGGGNLGIGIDLKNQYLFLINGNSSTTFAITMMMSIPSLTIVKQFTVPNNTITAIAGYSTHSFNPNDGYFYFVDNVNSILYQYLE